MLATVLALSATFSACGSNVAPETIADVNGAYDGGRARALTEAGAAVDPGATEFGNDSTGGDTGAGPAAVPLDSGGSPDGPAATADRPDGGTDSPPAIVGIKPGNCAGFDNDQPGITKDTVLIANVSDISGPVPGLFAAAQQATRAFAAYFNATGDLCGHKLQVLSLDSRADGGADQQAYAKSCTDTFAAVGSMSAFDSGGASTAQACGLPDLRSTSVTPERRHCSTCFAAQSVSPNLVPTSMPKYWVRAQPKASQHVAVLFADVGAARINAESFQKGWTRSGWKIDYFEGIDVSEFNYTPYVQQMKDRGIDFVVYLGPYQYTVRLQQAMKQQSLTPAVFLQDATIYDQGYVDQAGEVGDGSYVYSTTALFDDFSIPEMRLYRDWLQRASPGAEPNYYGLYAWSAARLFTQTAVELGGRLTRKTLVDRLTRVRNWTSHGLHAPQQVGTRATANCLKTLRLNNGRWSQVSPGGYFCGPLVDTGVGR